MREKSSFSSRRVTSLAIPCAIPEARRLSPPLLSSSDEGTGIFATAIPTVASFFSQNELSRETGFWTAQPIISAATMIAVAEANILSGEWKNRAKPHPAIIFLPGKPPSSDACSSNANMPSQDRKLRGGQHGYKV